MVSSLGLVIIAPMRGAVLLSAIAGCSFSGSGPIGGSADAPPLTDGARFADGAPPPFDASITFPIDAAPLVACPSSYDQSFGTSRYRLSDQKHTWLDAERDCEDDTNGMWSHLIVINTDDEWQALIAGAFVAHGGEWQLVGIVRDQATPAGPWRSVTGGTAPIVYWRQTIFSDEPTNSGDGEPVVAIDPGWNFLNSPDQGGFLDVSTTFLGYYVCECDSLPPVDASY